MPSTLVSLRKKEARLVEQLTGVRREIAALEGVPTQADLAGMPPPIAVERKLSVHELHYNEFQSTRRNRMKALDVEFVPDERLNPAFINARMKTIRSQCESDEELWALFTRFMSEDYWARKSPPYPFAAFAADVVWQRLQKEHRA